MSQAVKPSRTAHRRTLVPYVVLAVSLLLTAAAALYVGTTASANDRQHFEVLAERAQAGITRRLDTYIDMLRGASGLFASQPVVKLPAFRAYLDQLDVRERYPGVQGIGVSLRIPADVKDKTLAQMRAQPGLENLTIRPANERREYHAIVYLEPLDARNQRAIGYDMFTEPTRRTAMERARDTAAPALSGRVTLVQEEDGDSTTPPQPGFLIYLPLYYAGPAPLGVDDRRTRLAGFVYSPFRAGDLFEGIFGSRGLHAIAFDVYDGTVPSPAALVHRSDAAATVAPGIPSGNAPRFSKLTRLNIAGHLWTVVYRTRPEFETSSSRPFTLLVIAAGAIVSIVLFTLSFGQATARLRAELAADELRESEQALRASESKFRRLSDANLVGVAFADIGGAITDANDAFLRILGRSREELERGALRWDTITPPEYGEVDQRSVAQLRATGVCTPFEKEYFRSNGTRVPVLVGVAMLEGETGESVGICIDLTERNRGIEQLKAARDAADAARDAADAARAEAEEANRLKDEFLATVSHELRTPLNAILGWAQILRRGSFDSDDFPQGIATIERNAKAQAQLVEDLLDVSRIVSGKLRLDVATVDLAGVIDAAIESVTPAADAKGLSIQRVFDPHVGPVWGDPDRLQQVVWNLLSNAVKFTPRGGSVQVLLQSSDGNAEVAVSDTGRGISRDFLPHVFDRFRQADASITRQFGGLGLGLGIVRHLVELHGGTVAASSMGEGKGATFVVTLPLANVPAHHARGGVGSAGESSRRRRPGDAGDGPSPSLRGVRVLVVEDEADSRTLLEKVLGDCGAEVTAVASAAEAFEAFTREPPPDVIVGDIGMPGEDGYSLLRRIRAAEDEAGQGAAHVPAIALTALARAEDRRRAMAAGYQVHMPKPIEPADLRAAIAELVGRSPVGA